MPPPLEERLLHELPLDEVALAVLRDLADSQEWNQYNYMVSLATNLRWEDSSLRIVEEALTWLRARSFLAHTPGQSHDLAIFVTRSGRQALTNGLPFVRARDAMQEGLHPAILSRTRRQFLLDEHEQAVFVAMKAVEVRVRELGEFGPDDFGVPMMNAAFGKGGRLRDPDAVEAEQEGLRSLFAGAYGALRNPSGHRDIDYDDVAEAAEAVALASLLMRVLDRVERRLRRTNE